MQVGDLVRLDPEEDRLVIGDMIDERCIGTVLRFDPYRAANGWDDPIVEVLWDTGAAGWVLKSRVEVINESR